MLVIRLQRTGRKGHAMFRIVVQDSRRSPSSGKVVALLGNYDPHAKTVNIDKEKAVKFMTNGAQPSDRVISILKSESVKLPNWVVASPAKKKTVKSPEKRRSTSLEPKEKPVEQAPAVEAPTEEAPAPAEAVEAPAEQPETSEEPTEAETPAEEAKVEGPTAEPEAPASEEEPAEEASVPETEDKE
ncbi:MAG: 30S ribosomal protein S16 [Candidatus Saccharibacteria bacterium]